MSKLVLLLGLAVTITVALLLIITQLMSLRQQQTADTRHVYSTTEVESGLTSAPKAWIGRTVLVRGWVAAEYAGFFVLEDSNVSANGDGSTLLVHYGGEDRVLALLRRVPFIRSLVAAPQRLRQSMIAIYRLNIRAVPDPLQAPVPEVVLVDAQGH